MAKTIKLNYITKVEGHANLDIRIDKGKVKKVNLKIFEGARFFEGLVTGMHVKRVPLITSRICGVCSQAHLIASSLAIENAYGIKVSEQTSSLRKLLLYASIIQSHVLHLFFMSLPDYYSIDNAITLAKKKPSLVKLALKIKMLANKIIETVGGREIHSITMGIGGFNKLPSKEKLSELGRELRKEKKGIQEEFKSIFPSLKKMSFESECDYLALHGDNYAPFNGILRTLSGKRFAPGEYRDYLSEYIKRYSTSKFVSLGKKCFITGPLARINLTNQLLNPGAKELLGEIGLKLPNQSPFNNNLCQAVEIIHYYEECLKILEGLEVKGEKPVGFKPKKQTRGMSTIEVPRGVLFHEYVIDKEGKVSECNIITPTTQNVHSIEKDIKAFLPFVLDQKKKQVEFFIERLIRAYDPCISCSTHFLKIKWV